MLSRWLQNSQERVSEGEMKWKGEVGGSQQGRGVGQAGLLLLGCPSHSFPARLASFLYNVDKRLILLVSSLYLHCTHSCFPILMKQLTFIFKTTALKSREVEQLAKFTQITSGFHLGDFYLFSWGLWAPLPSAHSGHVGWCLPYCFPLESFFPAAQTQLGAERALWLS